MKKNLLLVIGMCIMLGLSACGMNVDSDVSSESLPAVESTETQKETIITTEKEEIKEETPKIYNLKDYLEAYGQAEVEGEYITVTEVEGLTFVPKQLEDQGISISIYNNGESCGWISAKKFDTADWMENADMKLTMALSSHTGGAKVIETIDTDYGKRFLVVDESNLPFAYADTEWLVKAGVFKDIEEACSQYDSRYYVVYGAEGSEYAYIMSIDKHFINDNFFNSLLNKITFKPEAFTKEGQETYCTAVTTSTIEEDDLFDRLFEQANSANMQIRFKAEDLTYQIPENMMAIQMGKGVWNLFKYSMSYDKEVGTVEYLTVDVTEENLQSILQQFVPDAKYEGTEAIKNGQVFTFTENGEENTEHLFVVPKKGEAVLHLHYKVF